MRDRNYFFQADWRFGVVEDPAPNLTCANCGHFEPGVRLVDPENPHVPDPLVLKGEMFDFVSGWAILILLIVGIPALLSIWLSVPAAIGITIVIALILMSILGND